MSGEATSNYFQRLDSIIPKAELDILRYSEEIELHSGDKPFVKESLEIELLDNKTFLEKEANNPYYILDNGTLVRYDSRVFRVPNITTLILEDLALGKKGRYVFPNPLECRQGAHTPPAGQTNAPSLLQFHLTLQLLLLLFLLVVQSFYQCSNNQPFG